MTLDHEQSQPATIDMPDLAEVDGNLTISGNTSATVIDAAALVTVGGDVTIDLSLDATVSQRAGPRRRQRARDRR